MKSATRTTRRDESLSFSRDDHASKSDILAILTDIDNGHEFYMSLIDSFQMDDREYVVMYPWEPDDGEHAAPEITILQVQRHVTGEQYYLSIKNRYELEAAFDVFFRRFQESGAL